jgi:hypothetical protein
MNSQMGHSETAGEQAGGQGAATQPPTAAQGAATASDQAAGPSEEQLRAAYEAELSKITSADMVLQAAASLLNIGAHRLGLTGGSGPDAGPPEPRDLEQVRDAIDAVRGLLPVIERSASGELRPLRDALSQLQMAYSRAVQASPAPPAAASPAAPSAAPTSPAEASPAGAPTGAPASEPSAPAAKPPAENPPQGGAQGEKPGPGPAESSGRLWVPGR